RGRALVIGPRDRRYLNYVRESLELIERYAREGRDTFLRDPQVSDAVLHRLETLAEAASRLSDGTQSAASQHCLAGHLGFSQRRRPRILRRRAPSRVGGVDGRSAGAQDRRRGGAPERRVLWRWRAAV